MSKLQLNSLLMKNFKCFKKFQINFGKLTVLSGYNGTGKSTAIQPILLLAQMIKDSPRNIEDRGKFWPLNGDLIRLGSGGDVIFAKYDEPEIYFEFGLSDDRTFTSELDVKTNARLLSSRKVDKKLLESMEFISRLSYISAIRGNNENLYPRPDNSDYSEIEVGADGRYASFLYNELADQSELRSEVDEWLSFVAGGAKANVLSLSNSRLFELNFKPSATLKEMLPINVGYGLTYAFPIIVASLAALEAKKGDIIIVDSPEAHLHPRAQSRMGWKLAQIAAKGVQIILETHSDHILNGIRLAVKERELMAEDLKLLFFSDAEDGSDGVSRPEINQYGNLNEWPEGFFDQNEIDLAKLIGV